MDLDDLVEQISLVNLESFKYLCFVFVTALLIRYVISRSFTFFMNRRNAAVIDACLYGLERPIIFSVWVLAVERINQYRIAYYGVEGQRIENLAILAFVWLVVWSLWRFARRLEQNLVSDDFDRIPLDAGTADAFRMTLRALAFAFGVLVSMQVIGVPLSSLVAFGSASGLMVGYAAKDLVANFAGAVMLRLDRPFTVGEWVRSPDQEIEGVVEDIGLRITRIRTFDQRPLYIPNSTFTKISVETPSRMRNRRLKETIGVRYQDGECVESIIKTIRSYLVNHEEIDTERVLIVNLNGYGHSALEIMVYCFTKTTGWVRFHEIKEQILLDIFDIIRRHGAEIAYPTQTLHHAGHASIQPEPN